ncbi:hypothetical protein RvY_06885 [Ramazzottius varieornatus]|uniref:Uncharacterized protein n=1 Tax=Ramazzottius varieornatus TaxID=947166 RepID=A0A1D1V061_RAMVA|nr:hypothetical protein RvY_06885 [Ramazzottius varieornatus]
MASKTGSPTKAQRLFSSHRLLSNSWPDHSKRRAGAVERSTDIAVATLIKTDTDTANCTRKITSKSRPGPGSSPERYCNDHACLLGFVETVIFSWT